MCHIKKVLLKGVIMVRIFSFLALLGLAASAASPFPLMDSPPPSSEEARILLPGILSTGLFERDFTISPEGDEIYFTVMGRSFSVILVTHKVKGKWSVPAPASFSGEKKFFDAEPCLTPDGKRIYFLSTRPLPGDPLHPGWGYENIWMAQRTSGGWSDPLPLGREVNDGRNVFYPTFTRDGVLYYTASPRGGERKSDLFRAFPDKEGFTAGERLPEPLNTLPLQFNSAVDPQGKYLLFLAAGSEENQNASDIWVSFRRDDDRWSKPQNLGPGVNFPGGNAQSVSVTPDGRFIVFAMTYGDPGLLPEEITYQSLQTSAASPRNGLSDLYWIDAGLLDNLKEKAEW